MIRALAALVLAFGPAAAWAQEVATAPVAVLRGLDRLSGELTQFEVRTGETATYRDLFVTVAECRYPADNPAGDAFAYLTIQDRRESAPDFAGWMIASSPALHALDHPRYDVWLIRCNRA